MKATILPWLLAGLLPLAAQAQTVAPAVTAPAAPVALTSWEEDTLRAVGRLYERRRHGGRTWFIISGIGVLPTMQALIGTTTETPVGPIHDNVDGGAVAIIFATFIGIPAAIGISKSSRFDARHEKAVKDTYRHSRKLPSSIRRRLTRQYFGG